MQAQSGGLQLSPTKSSVTAEPGKTVTIPITLQNSTNKPLTARVSALDFTASDALNGEPRLLDTPNQKYGIANWLKDSNIQRTLTIPAKQTVEYLASFNVPVASQPRTYFGSVIFTYTPEDSQQAVSLGSLVFITVGNPAVRLSVDTLSHRESETAAEPFGVIDATLTNSSEGLASPTFRLKITGDGGRLIEEIVHESAGSILPESSRRYSFAPTKKLPAEHLTFTLSATDQHGNTVDKSFQHDLSPEANVSKNDSDESAKPNNNLLIFSISLLVLVLLAGGLWAKKVYSNRQRMQLPIAAPDTDDPDATIHSSDKNSSNQ